jgi:hypothetical protein
VLHQHVDDLLNALHAHIGADRSLFDKGLFLHVQQLANADGRIRLGHFVSSIFLLKAMNGRHMLRPPDFAVVVKKTMA